jgi:hypothetical protein
VNRHLTPAEIADGIVPSLSLRPSNRQLYRRWINSFRRGVLTRPYGLIEERCALAADRLDRSEEIRWCRRMSEASPVILDEDEESHRYTTERNQRDIARAIYHGGERP